MTKHTHARRTCDPQCDPQCDPHSELAMHGRTDGRTYGEAFSPSRDNAPSVTRTRTYVDSAISDYHDQVQRLQAERRRLQGAQP